MKYWHGWLLLKMPFHRFSVIISRFKIHGEYLVPRMLKSPSVLKNIASTDNYIHIWSGRDFIFLKTSPSISCWISICNKTKLWLKQKLKLCFGCRLPKLPSPSDTYSCACGTMQHCNVEDISLQPSRLEAEEVREKKSLRHCALGTKGGSKHERCYSQHNNGRKDMVQVCGGKTILDVINTGAIWISLRKVFLVAALSASSSIWSM